MQSDPVVAIIFFAIAAYLFKMWLDDTISYEKTGDLKKGAFVGLGFVGLPLVGFAIVVSLGLLGVQCVGESYFGIVQEQSTIGYFAILTFSAAAFIEELVFRGYFVVDKTKLSLVASILGFSLIFALAHPFLWDFSDETGSYVFSFDFSFKAFYYTFFIFLNSIFFYLLRFNKFNPKRSLLPCFTAHLAYNVGVYVIKLAQGFVE